MKKLAIKVERLQKSFKGLSVFKRVDFEVEKGSIFALAPGKTTIVKILTTVLKPYNGKAIVGGFDVTENPGHLRQGISLTGR